MILMIKNIFDYLREIAIQMNVLKAKSESRMQK